MKKKSLLKNRTQTISKNNNLDVSSLYKKYYEDLKKEFSFDLYGRYKVLQEIIDKNREKNKKFKILDVGGRGNIMKKFLPFDEVYYLDPYFESSDDNFIKGDGCDMAFNDEEFDWVVSADVFEHIDLKKRNAFLKENIRVAKEGVILAAPFYSEEIAQAEKDANENYKILNNGQNHPWLIEHIMNGLPSNIDVETCLNKNKFEFEKFHNNSLSLWNFLIAMSSQISLNLNLVREEYEKFNEFYNNEIYPIDNEINSYRTVYFIKKNPKFKNIGEKNNIIPKKIIDETIRRALDLMAINLIKINERNKAELNNKIDEFKQTQEQIKTKTDELKQTQEQIKTKTDELTAVYNSKRWKLISKIADPLARMKQKTKRIFARILSESTKMKLRPSINKKKDDLYNQWIKNNEPDQSELEKQRKTSFTFSPKISIIVPVYNTPKKILIEMIESVLNQTYSNWELCIADGSDKQETKNTLKEYSKKYKRIKITFLEKNLGISGNSNQAIKLSEGDYLGLLDHDDTLAPFALFEIVKLINKKNPKVIYSDEDKLTEDGKKRSDPFFKPAWSPFTLRSQNYVCHFLVFHKKLGEEIGWLKPQFDGSQDYDLILRLSEKTKKIEHISKILYHWRKTKSSTALTATVKPHAAIASLNALNEHYKRVYKNHDVKAIPGKNLFCFSIKHEIKELKVSIIIPTKDKLEFLKNCVGSIIRKTNYKNYEIIIMDNNSVENPTIEWLDKIQKQNKNIRVIKENCEFNWAKINNKGAENSKGEILIFLNNDCIVINKNWINRFVELCTLPDVGIVGGLLLYPNNTIQHAGVVLGIGGYADHIYKGQIPEHGNTPYLSPSIMRNVTANTGACLGISKDKFNKIGAFNENFIICGSDVELCLRAMKYKYNNIYEPLIQLYHLESKTRNPNQIPDIDFTLSKKYYAHFLKEGDPYYNMNLLLDTQCRIK